MTVPSRNFSGSASTRTPTGRRARAQQSVKQVLRRIALTRVPLPPADNTKDISRHPAFMGSVSRGLWKFFNIRVTRAGRWFFGLTFALSILGTASLDVQTYIPLLYCTAVWAVASVVSWFVRPNVSISARHPSRIRAGETLSVTLQVENQGRRNLLDLHLLPSRLPLEIDSVPIDGVPIGTLMSGEIRTVQTGLLATKRGAYTLRGWRVETDFPFGLLNAYREYREETELLVHPAYTSLTRLEMPTGRRLQPGGISLASRMGDSMEYLGNREFREGDPIRDIDWRATARMGGMPVVREWREEYFKRVGVVLDTYVPPGLRPKESAIHLAALERAVSLTAAVSEHLATGDYLVDLFAVGPNLYHLTAGRSLAYQEQMLDILACVEPSDAEPLPTVAPQIGLYLEQLTTIVCVFLSWDSARQAFADELRSGGAAVKIILVTDDTALDDLPSERDFLIITPESFAAGVNIL